MKRFTRNDCYEEVIGPSVGFEKHLRHFINQTKNTIVAEVFRRQRHNPPGKKRRRKTSNSYGANPEPLASFFLEEMRALRDEGVLPGASGSTFVRDDRVVNGRDERAVGRVTVIGRVYETLEFIISRDTDKQQYGEKWGFPGGGRKQGETLTMTALRENQEETGVDIRQCSLERIGNIKLRRRSEEEAEAYGALFFVAIPEELLRDMQAGEEQDEVKTADEMEIRELIDDRKFLYNSITGWKRYLYWRANRK